MEDESCPGTLPCPCQGEQEQCLATEGGTIDIPLGNTTVVQVVRSPVNVVLSAYQYHTQEPAPEEWLEFMTMSNFSGWMFAGGVPYEALDSLGAHSRPEESFYSFLRRLPAEQGVKLQFWMSAWELYGFARQYLSLQQHQRQPGLRFLPMHRGPPCRARAAGASSSLILRPMVPPAAATTRPCGLVTRLVRLSASAVKVMPRSIS